MRLHVILLLASLAGMLLGGWLIAPWALGLAVALDSAAVGAWALFHDDGTEWQPQVHDPRATTLEAVFDRARGAA